MGLDDSSYNTISFVDSWKWLWSALSCLDNFEQDIKGRLFLDLMNEPDSMGQRWEVADNRKAGRVPGEAWLCRACSICPLGITLTWLKCWRPAVERPPITWEGMQGHKSRARRGLIAFVA